MPTYYDDEEGDSPPDMSPDTIELVPGVDMGTGKMTGSPTPFYSPEQATARNEVLSQALPPTVGVSPQAGLMGEATRAYRSGVPGLFVQGGPSVPAGMIEVNGQLERSQAAPQPVPWWITAADQFKEDQRQRDFLNSILAQAPQAQANQAIERAMQLEGVLGFDADRRNGVPVQEALMKHAPKMYFKSPASVSRLEVGLARNRPATAQPFTPTVTDVGGQQLFQISPQRFSFGPRKPAEKPQGLSPEGNLRAYQVQLKNLDKQAEESVRDKAKLAKIDAKRESIMAKIEQLQGGKPESLAAPPASQTQTSPRIALFRQLESSHPDWSKEKLIEEVRKQLK